MQEIEQDKHYVERFQLIPVDEQTYATYDPHGNPTGATNPNQVPTNGTATAIDAADMLKRENHSADREISIAEQQQQGVPTTVYVSQPNDEAEVLRYPSNAHVRYEDETAYHQARYDQIELVRSQHHAQQQQHPTHAHQAKVHIYEPTDGSTRTEVCPLFFD